MDATLAGLQSTVLTREALTVATDYILARRADGWTILELLADLDLPYSATITEAAAVRLIAAHWLTEIAPASRRVDADQRVRRARRQAGRAA